MSNEKVTALVFAAVDELNLDLEGEKQLPKSLEAPLIGNGALLDSLDLVSLVVILEDRILQQFGSAVTLVDERAMSQQRSPFRTLGSLAEFIDEILRDEAVART